MIRNGVRLMWCLALGLILSGCGTGTWQAGTLRPQGPVPQAPAPHAPILDSAYDDLTAFWQRAARALQIEVREGRLQQWNLGYDANGDVLYLTFKLYMERGPGQHDVYYFSQRSGQKASWSRQTVAGSVPVGLVPADRAFAAMNRIGFRILERHQKLAPPIRFWFSAASGGTSYRPIAGGFVVRDNGFVPIGPDGITIRGEHGVFGIAEGAVTTTGGAVSTASPDHPGPPLYVVPLSADG